MTVGGGALLTCHAVSLVSSAVLRQMTVLSFWACVIEEEVESAALLPLLAGRTCLRALARAPLSRS